MPLPGSDSVAPCREWQLVPRGVDVSVALFLARNKRQKSPDCAWSPTASAPGLLPALTPAHIAQPGIGVMGTPGTWGIQLQMDHTAARPGHKGEDGKTDGLLSIPCLESGFCGR